MSELVDLKKICNISSGGTPSRKKNSFYGGSIKWAKISDLERAGDGFIYDTDEKITSDGLDNIRNRIFEPDTLFLAMYGSVGKTAITKDKMSCNQAILGITAKDDKKLNLKYLRYWLDSIKEKLLNSAKGVALKNLSAGMVKELKIPLPPIANQKRIAEILDNATTLRDKTKQLIEEYDQLAQSIFLEMFGDPVINDKKFNLNSLLNFGSFKNGLNFSSNETGFEIKTLGVGDFKTRYIINDLQNLSTIHLTKLPAEDYLLKNGDLIFVRSNGNKKLVGRCLALYPNNEKVTFSGFCIRYRLKDKNLTAVFLTFLFRNARFKQMMLQSGRGANIQNINQKILSDLKIIIPPIKLQNQFADKIALIEQQKELAKQELKESEDLFQALLQKAFKGELV